jgi:predicted GTPase
LGINKSNTNSAKRKFEDYVRDVCACVSEGRPLSDIRTAEAEISYKAIRKIEGKRASNPEMTQEQLVRYARTVAREMWAEVVGTVHPDQSTDCKCDA